MSASFSAEKVIVRFSWTGPTAWRGGWKNGGLDVKRIDLIFQNAVPPIRVSLPDKLDLYEVHELRFTCYHEAPLQKTHPTKLSLTIKQIRNLQLHAILLEKNSVSTWTMMDHHGNITHDTHILRSTRKINFHVPSHLEAGKIYLLQVTSKELCLSASLVEEASQSARFEEDEALARDHCELFELLGGILLPLMGLQLTEFNIRIAQTSLGLSFLANPNANSKAMGIESIQKEIQNIEKPVLKQLAEDLRQEKVEHASKSLEDKTASEKKIIKACFEAIGLDSLQTIMRSNLENIIQSEITPEMRELIDSIAVRFQEICVHQVS